MKCQLIVFAVASPQQKHHKASNASPRADQARLVPRKPSAISASFSLLMHRIKSEEKQKMPYRIRQDTQQKEDAQGVHLIYMSDFAGLSVPKLKNLFFQKAQLSSARVAVYMDGGKKASPFFAFFQLRRLRRKSASDAPRFSVILPERVSEMQIMRFRIAKNPEEEGKGAFPGGKALL